MIVDCHTHIKLTSEDPETSEHLWAESYDRPLVDLFAIQSDIAEQITSALHVRVLISTLVIGSVEHVSYTTLLSLF